MGNKEKEFNTILDECLDRIIFRGETPEQCLADYPNYADDLGPLLDAAVVTNQVNELEPDPVFKSKARSEFLQVVREAGEKKKSSFFSFEWMAVQRRWVVSAAAVLVVLTGLGGTAAASQNSMPDDFLYPVKRATEQVQLAFTFTTLGKAEAYARLADNRVEEIIYMANLNDGNEIELLASSLNSDLMNIAAISSRDTTTTVTSEESSQAFMITADSAPTAKSNDMDTMTADTAGGMAADQTTTTDVGTMDTGSDADTTNGDDTTGIAEVANATDDGMLTMTAPTASPEVTVEVPPLRTLEDEQEVDPKVLLNSTIVDQAASNIQMLYELLANAPDSLKPAILKAIQLSEEGYEIAIDATRP